MSLTGTLIQLIDLKTVLSHAPASDPNMKAIHEGKDGPPNFQVLVDRDYVAPNLPADLNFNAALATVMSSERATAGNAPVSFVELRMADGKPVGQVAARGKLLRFDALTGAVLVGPATAPAVVQPPGGGQPSAHNSVKGIHRMSAYGDAGAFIFAMVALTMCAMLFTGLVQYFRLLRARARMGRPALFWSAGGFWRTLHRAVAAVAALFLVVVVLTGTIAAFGSVGVSTTRILNHGKRPGLTGDFSAPLGDAEMPGMLRTTLQAFRAANPQAPIRVLRLRYFAGMPQGVVVAGQGEDITQSAFDASTGRQVSLTEPNYPFTGQTFGWQADQIVKGIHRGDFIGVPGRFMSLFTGLSLLFLTLSGGMMYFDLWKKRRQAGRHGLFWP